MTRALCHSPRATADTSEADVAWYSLNSKSLGCDDQEELTKLQRMVSRSTSYSSLRHCSNTTSIEEEENISEVTKQLPEELSVRWMCSGEIICSVHVSPNTSLANLKVQVQEVSGVHPDEQRLLSCGQELTCELPAQNAPLRDLSLVRIVRDLRESNLAYFRPVDKFPELDTNSFTKIRKLTAGINGDVLLYSWRRRDSIEKVAVKKLRNPSLHRIVGTQTDERQAHLKPNQNAPDAEDSLTEIGILSYLSQRPDMPIYLLRMLGCFSDAPNNCTWLTTEFADGGELFDVVTQGNLSETTVREYTWQLLQAVTYLHQHHIAHRDISLENILLKDGVVRLMDFGMAVKSHTEAGAPLRFFRAVGKDFYRAPECYVPRLEQVRVVAPPAAQAGDVVLVEIDSGKYTCEVQLPTGVRPGAVCVADIWGYAAAPADVWSVGVSLFILGFKIPPWNMATQGDPAFHFFFSSGDNGVEALLRQWNKQLLSPEAMQLIASILKPDPSKRLSAVECLESPWFAHMAHSDVPVHPQVAIERC